MKKIFPILLAALILLSACGKEEAEETIKCTVSPTETTTATTSSTEGPEGVLEDKDTETVYLLTRMSVLDDSGNESWYREYEYNELGQKIEEFEYASIGDLSYHSVFTYDEAGLCTVTETNYMDPYDSSKLASVTVIRHTYDDKGRVIKHESFEDEVLVDTIELTYDDHNNILTNHMQDMGKLSYTYEYDANGNILTREEYLDGELTYIFTCKYDDQGRVTENFTHNAAGDLEMRSVFAWEGTTQTATYYDMEDKVFLTTISTYDDQGNITFQENHYSDGTVTMTEYFYEPFEITK